MQKETKNRIVLLKRSPEKNQVCAVCCILWENLPRIIFCLERIRKASDSLAFAHTNVSFSIINTTKLNTLLLTLRTVTTYFSRQKEGGMSGSLGQRYTIPIIFSRAVTRFLTQQPILVVKNKSLSSGICPFQLPIALLFLSFFNVCTIFSSNSEPPQMPRNSFVPVLFSP